MMRRQPMGNALSALSLLVTCGASLAACGEDQVQCPDPTLDISVCDPANGPFTLEIDNLYLPYAPGDQYTFEGQDGRTTLGLVVTVLDETEEVAGVTTRVVVESETENGETVEISRNYVAQAPDGTVCYFGEDVDIYDDGEVTSHSGAWRAGEGDNRPGIIMPANPTPGQAYFQESAPGIARDMGEIRATDATVTTPAGTFENVLESRDCNPLDGSVDQKYYGRDVGLIVDEELRLVSIGQQ